MTSYLPARAAGLVLGFAADRVFADPTRWHPVAGFGSLASRGERLLNNPGAAPRQAHRAGTIYTAGLVGGAALLGVASRRFSATAFGNAPAARSAWEAATTAAATWVALGGTSLLRVSGTIGAQLESDEIDAARGWLPWLCGRSPELLDAQELARATVESVAENTADAHVAPVVWGAVAGVPGILAYRAANTLDAMVGHRNERYEHFGWASARLDDLLNWAPARVAGLATVLASPLVGGQPSHALSAWQRDAKGHPSPNAGVVESTAAGALGITLGGRTPYAYGVEFRGQLNPGGRSARAEDVGRVRRLERIVQDGTVAAAIVALVVADMFRRPSRRARQSG